MVNKASPMKKPTSPKRVTTKAFFPASDAENFSYQKPMSRYEARPTNSQQIYSCNRPLEMVKVSMEKANKERKA